MAEEAGQILEAHILASLVPTTEVSVKHPKIFVTNGQNLHISTYSLSATPLQLRPSISNYCKRV